MVGSLLRPGRGGKFSSLSSPFDLTLNTQNLATHNLWTDSSKSQTFTRLAIWPSISASFFFVGTASAIGAFRGPIQAPFVCSLGVHGPPM